MSENTDAPKYLWKDVPEDVLCFHIHHDVLLEYSTEPLNVRAEWIRKVKHPEEIEQRLQLMRPVIGKLPKAVDMAAKEYIAAKKEHTETQMGRDAAEKEYVRAGDKYIQTKEEYARAAGKYAGAAARYHAAFAEHHEDIEAFHATECPDCPWNGRTIFPKEGSDE